MAGPKIHSSSMFMATWATPPCRNIDVTRRQYSPAATLGLCWAPSTKMSCCSPTRPIRNTATHTPMTPLVNIAVLMPPCSACCAEITRLRPDGWAHAGQRWPTAADVMHSVQMGRSHTEHDRRVSRSGWR
jgi:hypothetical protein